MSSSVGAVGGSICPHCGGSDIERDTARGDAVCTGCGSVLEDSIIVSEVTFQEHSSGSSSLVGQFVSSESGGGSRISVSGSGFHHGLNKDSREVTLQQAKRRLSHLGSRLRLNQHCIDMAYGFFKMALQLNLTCGRKSSIMDTACLYLVCRSEETPHMLLDFSDVLRINVYSLGRAYLKLSTALHINPPALDPCLYIHRFAHKLELGNKVHDVSMTALRLVARMKRDWIHHGRRPAGLCGAALLVAARLHNFNRSVRQVSKVVKLSEGTIRKRLGDFKDTPSSCLTIDEFLKIDLEQEHDPPCFLEAKKKVKQLQGSTSSTSVLEKGEGEGEREREESSDIESGGFGGIQLKSVQDIIAKARVTEAFLNIPSAGLSDDLNDLVNLVEKETNEPNVETVADEQSSEGILDLTGIEDGEIEQMLLSEEEVKIKSQLWFAENGDFLKELEARKEKLAQLEAEKATKTKKKLVRKKRKDPNYSTPANSAGEAIERMLVEKRISSKINYDVLRDLEQQSADMSSTADSILKAARPVFESRVTSFDRGPLAISTTSSRSDSSRLPSLTNRKRNLLSSSLLGSVNSSSSSSNKYQRVTSSNEQPSLNSLEEPLSSQDDSLTAVPVTVVEESGPVEFAEEEEEEEDGLGDMELEELVYDDDPLLHSDCEDEDGVDFFN